MARIITFSRQFPAYHPRAGQPTHFIEKIWASRHVDYDYKAVLIALGEVDLSSVMIPKHHTIRAGNRWKDGDWFRPSVWSGKPYNSKQIVIAPDIEIKKAWDVVMFCESNQTTICLPTEKHSQFQMLSLGEVAKNDGLEVEDFERWFNPKRKSIEFSGQIICWNENINY